MEKINQLNMTIQNIDQLNKQNINQLKDEFNKTIQIMQTNIASNDFALRAINETSHYGSSYSE